MNVSRSRRTAGSAFSHIISDALVWVVNTWHSAGRDLGRGDGRCHALGDLVAAAALRLDVDFGLNHGRSVYPRA